MPPKVDPNQEFDIYMKIRGGVSLPAQSIAPKVGPYGLPPKIVGDKIQQETSKQGFVGIKTYLKLHVVKRQPTVFIIPCASQSVLKALKEGPRSIPKGQPLVHNGSVSFEDVLAIAKQMRGKSKSIKYSGTVREILGTCTSVGCSVKYEGEVYNPKDLAKMIREGEIDCGEYEAPAEEEAQQ